MHKRPEQTAEQTLLRLGVDRDRAAAMAEALVSDLRSSGWRVSGTYIDRTG